MSEVFHKKKEENQLKRGHLAALHVSKQVLSRKMYTGGKNYSPETEKSKDIYPTWQHTHESLNRTESGQHNYGNKMNIP